MTPESKPQNIEVLLARSQKVDKIISRVTDLIVEPGGIAWPNNLQLTNYSGAEYLRRAAVVGKETEILNEDALPLLQRLKRDTDKQLNTIPAVKDLNAIRELVQKEVLPQSVLTKAEEEFERLKKEPISVAETPKEILKPESASLILPADQQEGKADQANEMLEIQGFNTIEKKPLYTFRDFAELIGKDTHYANSLISRIKKRGTRIQGKKEKVGTTRIILYTEEELLWLAEDYTARQRCPRRYVTPTAEEQALREPNTDTLTFQVNGKDVVVPKKEFYTNKDIAVAIGRDQQYVRRAVTYAKVINPTISSEYLKTNYGGILTFDQENFINIVTDIISRMKAPYKRRQTQSPPKLENDNGSETTVVPLKPQEIIDLEQTGTRRANQSPREQVLTRATLYMLSKLAERHPEEISRNVRVILGSGLPPRSTIPTVFGNDVTDERLKTELVNAASSALERYWSPDPKSAEDVLEDESRIIEICSRLSRQQGNSIRGIDHEISSILQTLPPRKYRTP